MRVLELEQSGFVCIGIQELQFVRGGVSAACFQDIWGYVKNAFEFLMEYRDDIIKGFRKGWNNL